MLGGEGMSRFYRSHRGRHGDGVATIVGVGVAVGVEDFDGAFCMATGQIERLKVSEYRYRCSASTLERRVERGDAITSHGRAKLC